MAYRSAIGVGFNPTQVPTGPIALNRAHPLASGLAGYWVLQTAGPLLDLTGRYNSVAGSGGAPIAAPSPIGPSQRWVSASANLGWQVNNGRILSGLPAWTIVGTVTTTNPTPYTFGTIFYCERAPSGNDILKLGQGSGFLVQMRDDSGSLINGQDGVGINDGRARTLIATYDSANVLYYNNGILTNTVAWPVTNAFNDSGVISSIGYDAADPAATWVGTVSQVALFKQALTADQVAQISAEPFAMLRPVVQRQYYTIAAGSSETITLDKWGQPVSQPYRGPTEMIPY